MDAPESMKLKVGDSYAFIGHAPIHEAYFLLDKQIDPNDYVGKGKVPTLPEECDDWILVAINPQSNGQTMFVYHTEQCQDEQLILAVLRYLILYFSV